MTKENKKEITQELWARFGKLSAQQEMLSVQIQQIVGQKRQVYSEIMKLDNSPNDNKTNEGKDNKKIKSKN